MRTFDEEIQTSGERRNQAQHQRWGNRNGNIRIRLFSSSSQRKSITSYRDDRAGGYSCSTAIGAITGGILEQLILEVKEDIANSEARVDQLRDRMELLTSLKASLEK